MAKFTFKRIELRNFMSYEYANIRLDVPGYILVSGRNNNELDVSFSNGSGKSTIFSAISWCLTGQTISGSKNVSNIYIENCKTEVELELIVDDVTYNIKRTKNPSNLFILVDGVDKSGKGIRDTSELLNEYLPDLTPELLNSVIILGQGLPQRFTNNSPSGRKEVLESLSKSDFMIEDLKNKLQNRKSHLDKELKAYRDTNIANSSKLEIYNNMLYELLPIKEEGYESSLQHKYSLCSDTVNNWIATISDNETTLSTKEKELSTICDELLTLSNKQTEEHEGKPLAATDKLEEEIYNLNVTIDSVKKEIKQAESVVDVCPTCGQKLIGVEKINTDGLRAELSSLESQLLEKQSAIEVTINNNNRITDEINKKYEELSSSLLTRRKELAADVDEIKSITETHRKHLEKSKEDLHKASTDLNEYKSKLEELLQLEEKITKINEEILYNNNEIDNLQNHLDVNSKMNTLIKRDFRGYLLVDIIQFIDKKAKEYCVDVFNHSKIDFALSGNNINIVFDGKEYELLSGGEKQKIDVIIQFSLRDMLCKYLKFSSNILVLDEITDSLDIVGTQQIFNLISNKLNDVQSIYIISHHTNDFEIPCDYEINIEKGSDKISRIV